MYWTINIYARSIWSHDIYRTQNIEANMQYYSPETAPAYEERNVWLKLCWLRMIYSVKTTDTVMLLALGSAYSLSSVLTHF